MSGMFENERKQADHKALQASVTREQFDAYVKRAGWQRFDDTTFSKPYGDLVGTHSLVAYRGSSWLAILADVEKRPAADIVRDMIAGEKPVCRVCGTSGVVHNHTRRVDDGVLAYSQHVVECAVCELTGHGKTLAEATVAFRDPTAQAIERAKEKRKHNAYELPMCPVCASDSGVSIGHPRLAYYEVKCSGCGLYAWSGTEREAVAHFEKPDKLARSQAEHVRAIRQSGKPALFRVMFPKETNVTISDKWKALTRDTPTGFYMARSAVKWDSQPLHVVVIETVSGDKAAFPACAATHLFCPLALYEGPEGTGWRDDTIKALEAKLADAENTVKDDHERLTGRLATMQKERDDYRAKFKLALSECEREDNERKVALRERDEARYANECQRPGESDSDHARRMLRLAKEANHRDDMAALKAANLAAGRNVTDAMREAAAEACLDNASERLSTEATTIGWLTLAVAFILGAASLACAWLFVTGKVMP